MDGHSASDSEETGFTEAGSATLTGFLFGNVNDKGDLEDDIFDEESKQHLAGLGRVSGIRNLLDEIGTDSVEEEVATSSQSTSYTPERSPYAVDYSDIKELADEEEPAPSSTAQPSHSFPPPRPASAGADDQVDDYDEPLSKVEEPQLEKPQTGSPANLMPPPQWVPDSVPSSSPANSMLTATGVLGTTTATVAGSLVASGDVMTSTGGGNGDTNGNISDTPAKNESSIYAPLADMLPSEFRGMDVFEIFPEFERGKVLPFSRLFKPQHIPTLYKKRRQPTHPTLPPAKKRKTKGELEGGHEDTDPVIENGTNGLTSETLLNHERLGPATHPDSTIVLDFGEPPTEDDLIPDDEVKLLAPEISQYDSGGDDGDRAGADGEDGGMASRERREKEYTNWRYGPNQIWYDMYGIDEGYNLGYQLKKDQEGKKEEGPKVNKEPAESSATDGDDEEEEEEPKKISDEAYLMVCQVEWEKDIIWDGELVKEKVLAEERLRARAAGWLPSPSTRTIQQYRAQYNSMLAAVASIAPTPGVIGPRHTPGGVVNRRSVDLIGGSTYDGCPVDQSNPEAMQAFDSLFPMENNDLIYKRWEDDIIWDTTQMDTLPRPATLMVDPNDEGILLGIPEDKDLKKGGDGALPGSKKEKEKEMRKSRIFMEKVGLIKEKEDPEENEPSSMQKQDPFNLSNDQYYNPKMATDTVLRTNIGGNLLQHSTPAVNLNQPFFPTFLGTARLQTLHRAALKKYSHGAMSLPGPHPVLSLHKHIKRKERNRESERVATGGGEIFFMRSAQDLSGCDGHVVLFEYSEEYPPMLNQVGMASKIKNYYKRKPGGVNKPHESTYGELAYAHHSPFLGSIAPGETIQTLENNMFRVPVYRHDVPHTDFLIIRNRQSYFIRHVTDVICAGQICPLLEVPGPNSKRANIFVRDFLQGFIYRLFWKSRDDPRRIKMEDIKKAFPSHSESSIRKRLKLCATFKRTGMDSNWWVIRSDFRLPTEEEIRGMISAEQCCLHYHMASAEQRLKDAGYGEKSLFAPDADEDEEQKIDDEIRTAPWNTTRAYISAMKAKCLLRLTGDADPTGCGEGFAYVRVPNKPTVKPVEAATPQKKTVTGTDADLRRLNLKDAKNLLRKFGVAEAEIKKLSRWEVIDVVRTMSTNQAKAGEAEGDMQKFSRGNRFSIAEHQERYKEECQRIFDLQNRLLGSAEVLSTDEESDDTTEETDFEEMGRNLENILKQKKTSSQLSKEKEEAERKELQRMLLGDQSEKGKDKRGLTGKKRKGEALDDDAGSMMNKKLVITRTFCDDNGREYTRSEDVTKPVVIEAYMRIRETKDKAFIQQFASLDEQQKEEMKRERRRIQEQLRRIKRNQEKAKNTPDNTSEKKKNKKFTGKMIKLKCGACGQVGHMKTNKECPLYNSTTQKQTSYSVALTVEEEEKAESSMLPNDENLIHVEGTKVKLSKQLLDHAASVKRKTLKLKFPKAPGAPGGGHEGREPKTKRRRTGASTHCDYLSKPARVSHRRRADPVVSLSSIFESIVNDLKEIPQSQLFHVPVNAKAVPDYHRFIKEPMDLQTMKQNCRERKYRSRESFLTEVSRIKQNSELYNGRNTVLTETAKAMFDLCLRRFAEKEDKLMRLEKAINPLLDNDLVGFAYILESIVTHLKGMDNVWPFANPVSKKTIRDYHTIIQTPMDLSTLMANVKAHQYHSREEFIAHLTLIEKNSVVYNGAGSNYTQTAELLVRTGKEKLEEASEKLEEFEEGIRAAQDAALEEAESESILTGTSYQADDRSSYYGGLPEEGDYSTINQDDEEGMSLQGPGGDGEQVSYDEEYNVDVGGSFEMVSGTGDYTAGEVGYSGATGTGEIAYMEDRQYAAEEGEGDVLVDDLHVTPENSDNDEGGEDGQQQPKFDPNEFFKSTFNQTEGEEEAFEEGQPMDTEGEGQSYVDAEGVQQQYGAEDGGGHVYEGGEAGGYEGGQVYEGVAYAEEAGYVGELGGGAGFLGQETGEEAPVAEGTGEEGQYQPLEQQGGGEGGVNEDLVVSDDSDEEEEEGGGAGGFDFDEFMSDD